MSIRILVPILVSLASTAHAQCYAVGTMHSFGGLNGLHTMHTPGTPCDTAATTQQPDRQRQTDQAQVTVRQPATTPRR